MTDTTETRLVRYEAAKLIVDEQANDVKIWNPSSGNPFQPTTEVYLRQELRRLHAAIEGEAPGNLSHMSGKETIEAILAREECNG